MNDDSIGCASILGAALVAFLVCFALLFATGIDEQLQIFERFTDHATQRHRASPQPVQWEWVYTADVGELGGGPDAGNSQKTSSNTVARADPTDGPPKIEIIRGDSPRRPSPPPGGASGRGGGSKIEIIDIGGSMTPVDATGRERAVSVGPVAAVSKFEGNRHWPMRDRMHWVAKSLPSSVETSYQRVAKYIASKESNRVQQVKAVHDYITTRLKYDYPAFRTRSIPPQHPAKVFEARTAVCEGYARLFKAMMQEIGIEASYIVGVSRQWISGSVSDLGHAWNAVKLDGKWYLVDVTWGDDDYGRYSTDYLFVPPEVLGATHFPNSSRWQLRDKPISRARFKQLPLLKPAFHAAGLRLVSPERAENTTRSDPVIELRNPRGRRVSASFRARGQRHGPQTRCSSEGAGEVRITCDTPPGRHTITVWADREFVAVFYVHRL